MLGYVFGVKRRLLVFSAVALVFAVAAAEEKKAIKNTAGSHADAVDATQTEWSKLHTKAILPPATAGESGQGVIQFQVRYHNPLASRVCLVWGVDKFTRIPPKLPAGSFLTLNDSHINTYMKRDGNDFVFDFELDENRQLDYAFNVIDDSDGNNVNLWRGANSEGGYYSTTLTAATADEKVTDSKLYVGGFRSEEWSELHTKAVLSSGSSPNAQPPLIRFRVRYRNPEASAVRMIWGLDNFTRVPSGSAVRDISDRQQQPS